MAGDSLLAVARDLHDAATRARPAAAAVVKRGALNIKRDWRANAKASAGTTARVYPYSIGFDLEDRGLTAVIGPDKDKRQGALGNLLEYGSVHNTPHNDGGQALAAETPRFEQALVDQLIDRLLW